jgi:hypothetical protein
VQLQQAYPGKVHAISLNIEYDGDDGAPPAELQAKVRAMLARQGVNCENIMCSGRVDENLAGLELSALPAALIYGADGNLLKKFDGTVDYEGEVLPLIEAALAKE